MKILLCTICALIAFAGNSVLCRLALESKYIDAGSFTAIRLASGSVVLAVLMLLFRSPNTPHTKGSNASALFLFIYAAAFSFAYQALPTGVGALVLFAAVQITMIVFSVIRGQALHLIECCGLLLAFGGLAYLLLPGLSSPSLFGFLLMALAGIAWGFYSLNGHGSEFALQDTAFNFIRALPLVLLLVIFNISYTSVSFYGAGLAIVAGGLTSGLGYALWYSALKGLSSVQAAVVQLLVPVIAACGGWLFADEPITLHFVQSSLIILAGVALVITRKHLTSFKLYT